MRELTEQEEDVGRYYDEVIHDAEIARLQDQFPVEYAIAARHLPRRIPDNATVAEIGVGCAHLTGLEEFRNLFASNFLAGRLRAKSLKLETQT